MVAARVARKVARNSKVCIKTPCVATSANLIYTQLASMLNAHFNQKLKQANLASTDLALVTAISEFLKD